jgi:hypothetical protein
MADVGDFDDLVLGGGEAGKYLAWEMAKQSAAWLPLTVGRARTALCAVGCARHLDRRGLDRWSRAAQEEDRHRCAGEANVAGQAPACASCTAGRYVSYPA